MRWFAKKDSNREAEAGLLEDESGADVEETSAVTTERWTAGRQLTTTLVAVGLWGLVACGPIALFAHFASPAPVAIADPAPAGTPGLTASEQFAGAHAEAFVGAWLRATRHDSNDLAQFIAIPSGAVTAEQPLAYRDLSVASIEPSENGLVAVTVSVAVADAYKEEKDETVPVWHQRYYQVMVRAQEHGMSVLSLPTQVSGPSASTLPKIDYVQFSASSAAGETVQLFLSAYLAASGDLGRTLSPGAEISAVDPAPYVSVRSTKLSASTKPSESPGTGDVVHVRAEVEATLPNQHTVSMTYWFTLTARDGRWEVSSVDSGPTADAVEFDEEAPAEPPSDGSAPDSPTETTTPNPASPDDESTSTETPTETPTE